ncbi:hypothetical protein GCM10009113_11090 [Marinobacter szutsaonensis]
MREIDALDYWEAQGSAYFRDLSMFGVLRDEVILRLLNEGRVLALDAGEALYTPGDPNDTFSIVLSGRLKSLMPRIDGGWALARCHEPGEDAGFVAMIALREHRPTLTTAEMNSVVLEISFDQFCLLHLVDPAAFGLMLINLTGGMARGVLSMAVVMAEQGRHLHKAYRLEREWRRERNS